MIRRCHVMEISCIASLLAFGNAMAQRATDAQMAEQALGAVVRTTNAESSQAIRSQARQHLNEMASGPGRASDAHAVIVFSLGLSAAEVQGFAQTYNLEVISAEAKFPMADDGQVMTVSAGVTSREGELRDLLRMSTGGMQFRIMQAAQSLDSPEREQYLEVVNTPDPKYYRIDAIGLPPGFRAAATDGYVADVFIESTGEKVREIRAAQARFAEMRRLHGPPTIRRLEDGPPPGVTPDRIIPIPLP